MGKVDLKKLLYVPEILLLSGAVVGFFEELIRVSVVNYFVIACIVLLLTLLIWKNRWLALSLSIVLGMACFYFLLACYSEYKEFPANDNNGIRMMLTGCMIFGSLLVISAILPGKYFSKHPGIG
jgi:VIT1/CCC1 family predicted Fe2+/Mn2+ transporter